MTESTEEIRLSHDLPDAGMSRFSLLNEQMILISLIRTGTGKNIVSLKMAGSFPYSEDMIGFIGIPLNHPRAIFLCSAGMTLLCRS